MSTIEHHEYIDQYLLGELSADEKAAFETAMKNDPELAQEVEIQKLIIEGIVNKEAEKLKASLQEIDNQLPVPNFRFMEAKKYIFGAIAAAAVVISAVLMLFRPDNKLNDQLFAQNFSAMPANPDYLATSRGDESPVPGLSPQAYSIAVKAMQAYDKKDFTIALDLFHKALQPDLKIPDLLLYQSICQLQQNQSKQALANLEWLTHQESFAYNTEAKWYLALAYLKNHNKAKAVEVLTDIADTEGDFAPKAKTILARLKK